MKSVPHGRRSARPLPPPVEEDDDEFTDEEYDDDDEEDDEDENDIGDLMIDLLSYEEDNVCSAMLKVAKQLETTNRLLVKMLASNVPQQQQQQEEGVLQTPKRRRRPQAIPSSGDEPVDLTEDYETEEQAGA